MNETIMLYLKGRGPLENIEKTTQQTTLFHQLLEMLSVIEIESILQRSFHSQCR